MNVVPAVGQAGSNPDLTCLSVPSRPACTSELPLPDCPQKPMPAKSASQDYLSRPVTVELPPLDYPQTRATMESASDDYRWPMIPGNIPLTIIFQSRFHGASFCGLSAAADSWESAPADNFSGPNAVSSPAVAEIMRRKPQAHQRQAGNPIPVAALRQSAAHLEAGNWRRSAEPPPRPPFIPLPSLS